MENDFISEEYMEFLKSISALEKQVADDKLAIAGLQGNIAGRKLRKIMNKKIALIESSHDDCQPKDPVKHYDPINKKFLYFSY